MPIFKKTIQISILACSILIIGILIYKVVFEVKTTSIPRLQIPTLSGQPLQFPDPQKRLTWLTAWSISCSICLTELPDLENLHKTISKGAQIATVTMPYDPPNLVLNLVTEQKLTLPVGLDLQGAVSNLLEVHATPGHFLIAADGQVLYRHYGRLSPEFIRSTIQSAL